jgi:hypothetical protein
VGAGCPGAGAGMDPGGAQPGQPVRILGQALDDPPDGRVEATGPNSSGWSRKAARSLKQSPPSASITAKVPQHGRVRMTAPATDLLPAKHAGQPEPVGQLPQQRRPAWPTTPMASVVTSKLDASW